MDAIEKCFSEHNKALLKRLITADLTIGEANRLLPEIELALYISCRQTSEFQTITRLFSKFCYEMSKSVDIDALATKVGIDAIQVTAGLRAIAPLLLQVYAENNHRRAQASAETNTETQQPPALCDTD
jgi:hypothetical protein